MAWLLAAACVSFQHSDGFDMCSVREHIDGLQRLNPVTLCANLRQFCSERFRMTRDVDCAGGLQSAEDLAQYNPGTPLARRVEDHGVGVPEGWERRLHAA